MGICRWTFPEVPKLIVVAMGRRSLKVIRRQTVLATYSSTLFPIRKAVPDGTLGAILRGTCRRACRMTSTASCGSGLKSGLGAGIEPRRAQRRQRVWDGV